VIEHGGEEEESEEVQLADGWIPQAQEEGPDEASEEDERAEGEAESGFEKNGPWRRSGNPWQPPLSRMAHRRSRPSPGFNDQWTMN
jgi:hypothetical protein